MPKQKKYKQPRTPKLAPDLHAVERLYRIIASLKGADPHTSYTARLLSRGTNKIAQKLGEEATETVIEAVRRDRELVVLESAAMLYHLLALWASLDIDPKLVWRELKKREGRSGIEEKKSRKAK